MQNDCIVLMILFVAASDATRLHLTRRSQCGFAIALRKAHAFMTNFKSASRSVFRVQTAAVVRK